VPSFDEEEGGSRHSAQSSRYVFTAKRHDVKLFNVMVHVLTETSRR